MNLLQAGIDISTIAIWLGHNSIETTHKYMVADLEIKRKVMEKAGIIDNSVQKFKPSDYSLLIAPVVADLCTTPVALSAPPNSYQNNSQS